MKPFQQTIKLSDFKLHFATGHQLGFGQGTDDRVQVLEPSDFHFKTTDYRNMQSGERLVEHQVGLKRITIIGVTTGRAVALRDILANFITNFNGNAYGMKVDENGDHNVIANEDGIRVIESDENGLNDNGLNDIHLDVERQIERQMAEALKEDEVTSGVSQKSKENMSGNEEEGSKYKSELKVEFGRLDVFMHDETKAKTPKIFSFGFHNFNLIAVRFVGCVFAKMFELVGSWHFVEK